MINVELGRSASTAFNINDSEVRALAGIPSGPISFSDFYGKANEIVVTLSSSSSPVNFKTLFSSADWASETKKRIVIPSGIELGTNTTSYVCFPLPTADGQAGSWGGDLILENNGTISGAGGAANSGSGGHCVYGNLPGKNGQKLIVNNYGTIRAGGGGGGKGGTGGAGYYYSTATEGPYFSTSYGIICYGTTSEDDPQYQTLWAGSTIYYAAIYSGQVIGAYTYYRGAQNGSSYGYPNYAISRTHQVTNYTTGGAGGAGGVGQGYGQSRASGSAGAAGGTNAGKGGTGGTGGTWGTNGGTGATGASGNNGSGSAGSSGGPAGYYIRSSSNITFNNYGTVLGTLN